MSKGQFIIPIYAAALGIAFVAVALLVFLTRGHPYFIKKKLRIGALLLSLTAVAAGTTSCPVTCYYQPMPLDEQLALLLMATAMPGDTFYLLEQDEYLRTGSSVSMNLAENNVLTGTIQFRRAVAFSFRITDGDGVVRQTGDISPADGEFDESVEEFQITIDSLAPGNYNLDFFAFGQEEQAVHTDAPSARFTLKILESEMPE